MGRRSAQVEPEPEDDFRWYDLGNRSIQFTEKTLFLYCIYTKIRGPRAEMHGAFFFKLNSRLTGYALQGHVC
jgi:hypothetical protein